MRKILIASFYLSIVVLAHAVSPFIWQRTGLRSGGSAPVDAWAWYQLEGRDENVFIGVLTNSVTMQDQGKLWFENGVGITNYLPTAQVEWTGPTNGIGAKINMDSTADRIDFGSGTQDEIDIGVMAVEMWIKPTSLNYQIMGNTQNSIGGNNGWHINNSSRTLEIAHDYSTTIARYASDANFFSVARQGLWTHVVVNLTTNITCYRNGTNYPSATSTAGSGTHVAGNLQMAISANNGSGGSFQGNLGMVRIYTNRILTAGEVFTNWVNSCWSNPSNQVTTLTSPLIGGWGGDKWSADNVNGLYEKQVLCVNFNENFGAGGTIADFSRYENHGVNGSLTAAAIQEGSLTNAYADFDGGDSIVYTVTEAKNTVNFWGTTDPSNGWTNYMNAYGTQYVDGVEAAFDNIFYSITGNTITNGIGTAVSIDTFRVFSDFQLSYTNITTAGPDGNQ